MVNKFFGECIFFDVGQGTANLVLLDDGKAFLFDAGPQSYGCVHRFLHRHHVSSIECVVLSHNDADHVRGWAEIAMRFGDIIKNIYVLQDRPVQEADVIDVTMSLARSDVIPRPKRAEVRELAEPMTIWQDPARFMSLELLYPDMAANAAAQLAGDRNKTSAIVVLRCGVKSILFPGDSTIDAWKLLAHHSDNLPIKVDIMALSHHGGLLGHDTSEEELRWLFNEAVDAEVATVSVSTRNRYGHPRSEVITILRESKTKVICTQITKQCHEDVDGLAPGVMNPHFFSRSASTEGSGDRCSVACMGTVIAAFGPNDTEIEREREHSERVRTLKTPMCM